MNTLASMLAPRETAAPDTDAQPAESSRRAEAPPISIQALKGFDMFWIGYF